MKLLFFVGTNLITSLIISTEEQDTTCSRTKQIKYDLLIKLAFYAYPFHYWSRKVNGCKLLRSKKQLAITMLCEQFYLNQKDSQHTDVASDKLSPDCII